MAKIRFDVPYAQRPCPEGMVPEVWQAFGKCADCRNQDESEANWLAFLSIKRKYYDEAGNRLTGQLKIF